VAFDTVFSVVLAFHVRMSYSEQRDKQQHGELNIPWAVSDLEAASCYEPLNWTNRQRRRAAVRSEPSIP
jgi:hypothetical protein